MVFVNKRIWLFNYGSLLANSTEIKKRPLPKNKSDTEVAKLLSEFDGHISDKEFKQLIAWLKDVNWPVFPYVVEFLASRGIDSNNGL